MINPQQMFSHAQTMDANDYRQQQNNRPRKQPNDYQEQTDDDLSGISDMSDISDYSETMNKKEKYKKRFAKYI